MSNYGMELILDIENCDSATFTRKSIKKYFIDLCKLLDVRREDLHWWDYEGHSKEYAKAPTHLKGISAVQFISTSNITIHTLDDLHKIFINIFSCKSFNSEAAGNFSADWFNGEVSNHIVLKRF